MKFRTILLAALTLLVATSCTTYFADRFGGDPYAEDPFWVRYLNPAEGLDREISSLLAEIRQDGPTASLHNQLGALLVQKGFPKDAEVEFERALKADGRYYPAWYNIALARQARGDRAGARRALKRTLHEKPGHAAAHFQLGLMYEEADRYDDAIEQYARAFRINEALLDPKVNPRILDSELVDRTLIRIYQDEHVVRSLEFQPGPDLPNPPSMKSDDPEAPSDVAKPEEIVTPAPAPTDPQ